MNSKVKKKFQQNSRGDDFRYRVFWQVCYSTNFSFSLNSFVPDARFFAFSSTDTESRQEAANFWQVWYNTSFTSQDYGSFFVRFTTSRVTPTEPVSLITKRQTVEETAATPTYVQTSRTSSGKNIHIQLDL